ncbi:DUF3570 domain-containing protein [Segetibacter koreensis]|uniref:DUF3570 domain-containing protein n=1 Tax=Segetibacter koreensis TaxID=398037 RepID=UPI0003813E17|nr:DUF3570 domain-containing protein [Segetibacter koreensis]
MKKLSLAAIGMYISILSAFSQTTTTEDSSLYKSRKLNLDEVNFVSGYYHQNGNNSAVTGGIGNEKLTDFANTIDLKLSKYDAKLRKHILGVEVGVDHYTSASSDKIDPRTISSASMSDTRFYPSASYNIQNEKKRTNFGVVVSSSKEYDYTSFGAGVNFTKSSKDNNREFTAKLQAYLDTWKVIYPYELRPEDYSSGSHRDPRTTDYKPRDSYSASLSYSQIVNKRLQVMFLFDPAYQKGLLATKYQRVYFTDGSKRAETLPDHRLKIPLGVRANYFLGDNVILRSFYRYYQDDWGVKAHTIDIETAIKLTPFVSFSPFYRFYSQNAADYFAAYGQHDAAESFYTSDYDLSKFTSSYFGAGIRLAPPKGILGIQNWNSIELRYGHYSRSNGLQSDALTLHLKFK